MLGGFLEEEPTSICLVAIGSQMQKVLPPVKDVPPPKKCNYFSGGTIIGAKHLF